MASFPAPPLKTSHLHIRARRSTLRAGKTLQRRFGGFQRGIGARKPAGWVSAAAAAAAKGPRKRIEENEREGGGPKTRARPSKERQSPPGLQRGPCMPGSSAAPRCCSGRQRRAELPAAEATAVSGGAPACLSGRRRCIDLQASLLPARLGEGAPCSAVCVQSRPAGKPSPAACARVCLFVCLSPCLGVGRTLSPPPLPLAATSKVKQHTASSWPGSATQVQGGGLKAVGGDRGRRHLCHEESGGGGVSYMLTIVKPSPSWAACLRCLSFLALFYLVDM